MLRGIYTAAAGMMSQMIATDTLADNLANISTVGFKKRGVTMQEFPQMLLKRIEGNTVQATLGTIATGSAVKATPIDFQQGAIRQTGNPLDVAIEGHGFFVVQDANGQDLYTRNGSFTLDPDGVLITADGLKVQGVGGEIQLPGPVGEIQVLENGEVMAYNAQSKTHNLIGRLQVAQFENENQLDRLGHSLYKAPEGLEPKPVNEAGGFRVKHGALELSNVNAVGELVNTITGLRLYEALQKNIQTHNETLGRAVNDVGRVAR
ncbi:MAG: flagellar basal-body rod protein FlgF [Candidatus Melainabacteria bacterium]|nr:flagellar basal-body rod protein FlgF [Candidatus Melainabacteria bacterium]